MALIELATKAARKLMRRADGGRPRDEKVASFISPGGEIEVHCSEDEMEDFERKTGVVLEADIVGDIDAFQKLVEFLKDCGLKVV